MKANLSLLLLPCLCASLASAAEPAASVPGQYVSGAVRRSGYRGLKRLLPQLQILQSELAQARISELKAWPRQFGAYKGTERPVCENPEDICYYAGITIDLEAVTAVKKADLLNYHLAAVKAVADSVGATKKLVDLLQEESNSSAYNPAEQAVLADEALRISASYQKKGDEAKTILKAHQDSANAAASITTDDVEIQNPKALTDLVNGTDRLIQSDLESAGQVIARIRDLNEVYGNYDELMEAVRDPLNAVYVYFGDGQGRGWGTALVLENDLVGFSAARVTDEALKNRLIAEAKKNAFGPVPGADGQIAGILYGWRGSSPSLVAKDAAEDMDSLLRITRDAMERTLSR